MLDAAHDAYIVLQRGGDLPDLAALLNRPAWWDKAACRGQDQAAWFPGRGATTKAAKAICAGCPVRQQCLDAALSYPETLVGVFGGTTAGQRRKLRADRRRAAA